MLGEQLDQSLNHWPVVNRTGTTPVLKPEDGSQDISPEEGVLPQDSEAVSCHPSFRIVEREAFPRPKMTLLALICDHPLQIFLLCHKTRLKPWGARCVLAHLEVRSLRCLPL